MSQQFPSNGVAPASSGPRVVHASQPIFFRTALAAAISLAGLNAQAQTAPADATTLPPVVVSATGYPQPLADALPGVSVITREQIEQSGAQNLTTLLQQVAGVQVTSNGGPGQSGNVYVRGFGGPDVLVLLDGVPMNAQDATGVAYLNNFTTDQIQRIEIIRGNVSAIYGSGAIGGVVLITTRAGSKKPQASISVTAGSRNTATVSANASGQVGNTALQAGVSRYTTQGVSAINPAQLSNANPNSNGYGNTTMNGSIVQTLAPGQSLGLRAFSSKGRASYDSYGVYASPTDTNLSSTSQDLYQLFSDNQLTAAWKSHLSVSQQSTTNTTENFSAYPYSGTYRTRVQQLLWRNVVQLGSGWTATGGLEWKSQGISSITGSIPSRDRQAKAAFVGLDGSVNGNEFQLNLRHDAIDGYSGQNTGYFGYGRELGSGFKAIASYSTAFNAAPLGYLYAPYYGNANLKAEKAHSVEAGLQWSQGANVLRATLFQTKATDQWQYDFTTSTFQNIASSRTRGLELTGRGAWKGWAYDANLTLQQPVNTSLPGDPTLQRRARSLANVSVNHELASVLYGAAVHYSGPRWDNGSTGRVTLGSYTTVDLTASGAVSKDWSWNARVQNLFNKKYQTVYGYNREPLGVFVGLTWRPAF
ncbi:MULTISPECIES: TonB-dependent receptor [unclassified Thiomonas]|uniref:TonB-dependent receptor domain-containing protein n=1 Tax=unclassified Thiomonas TaxID=2625466 RepID=UPI000BD08A41|nr:MULTISPECIES: TonB-dependent receptor [unclassified Thiomonas]OZB70668.1 MAG: TonB-dependent receptor [Thiomonas sp. 13-64-67]